MPKRRSSYHKVDLEDQLLDAAERLLARGGLDALSLRELGREVGVSRSASYHYFPEKAALLARLGERGFAALGARIRAALDPTAPMVDQLVAGLSAYVEFALADPARFRLMFGNVLTRDVVRPLSDNAPALAFSSTAAEAAFAELLVPLMAAHAQGAFGVAAPSPLVIVNSCWALAHGVAELSIGDNLKPSALREAVLREGVSALVRGFSTLALASPRA